MSRLKSLVFRAARAAGVFSAVGASGWRGRRLLVLCYHGVSLDDEHGWNPSLYMPPAQFAERMRFLREGGYAVLPLAEGLRRVRDGTLPPKSVALTFDDGAYDFYVQARPVLERYALPATVYLTTYYAERGRPVFNTACQYMMWKGRASGADLAPLVGSPTSLPVSTAAERARAWGAVREHVVSRDFDGAARHALLGRVAAAVGVDFDAFVARGLLRIMTPDEVRALPRALIDVQLHTHRHRTPRDRALFAREIDDNRRSIAAMLRGAHGGDDALVHFCYPSGNYGAELVANLREAGVESATTCVPGLVSPRSEALLLPRFVDTAEQSLLEFEAWTSGAGELLPRRRAYRLDPARA